MDCILYLFFNFTLNPKVGYIALDLAFPQTAAANKDEPDNWKVHFYLSTAL